MKENKIAPSILSADFLNLGKEIERIEEANASFIHFDVMDGSFVPNISFGMVVLKSVSKIAKIKIDSHLMIVSPISYYQQFYKLGSYNVTVHIENTTIDEFKMMASFAKENNKSIGITLNPDTPIEQIIPYLNYANIALVMSVKPGFGGQSFIENSLEKILFLKEYREKCNLKYEIEVDGGINAYTAKLCRESGSDILVAGSYIFSSTDYKQKIKELNNENL